MPKIIVSMWTTLDGFVAGPEDELDWLRIDDRAMDYEQALVDDADALLLGRVTHGDFAGYWPAAARNPEESDAVRAFGRRLDELPKYVVSATSETATWEGTHVFDRIDPAAIAAIEGTVVVYGSLSIVRALTGLGLVDEFHLLLHPVYLREGQPLFGGLESRVELEPSSLESFGSGVTLMKARPAR
ncbi:pyrimidine reductase [Zhihengliuella salsuginis]|uniref:Pyrimidine reductase n=2 Tax=Zhihengliuella salsuginis TaxID=578222 RepID=A0ABQ3GGR2_9MICC|nr:pyrimidine reductase [Zhihengliuella salsuginis]